MSRHHGHDGQPVDGGGGGGESEHCLQLPPSAVPPGCGAAVAWQGQRFQLTTTLRPALRVRQHAA